VHGQIEALYALLGQLGYRADGSHPEHRLLVFVGDLVDRGPDSPAVLELVMKLAEAGHARSLLGNHELNLLLDSAKRTTVGGTTPLPLTLKNRVRCAPKTNNVTGISLRGCRSFCCGPAGQHLFALVRSPSVTVL